MPLGIVSDDELAEIDSNCNGSVNKGQVTVIEKGRGEGSTEVPESLRKIISDDALANGRASAVELAEALGVSPSSASAYANGSTSTATYNQKDNSLTKFLTSRKEKISKRASGVALRAIDSLLEENRLNDVKPVELAAIARQMAGIVRDMEPAVNPNGAGMNVNGPAIIVYSPKMANESDYPVVHAAE